MMRSITFLVLAALLAYAAICLYTYVRQRQLLYFPTPPANVADLDPLWLESDGERLKLWPLNTDRDRAVIYFGGNGEDVIYNRDLFETVLTDRAAYLVNYRGYGGSSGQPTGDGLYADALNVFDYVVSRHESVAVIGRSLGSAIATRVAARRPVERLVLVTPMDSVESLAKRVYPLLPVSLLIKDPYRAVQDAPEVTAPTLVVIAERDNIVPAESTARLVASLLGAPVTRDVLSGHDHNSFAGDPAYGRMLGEFMRSRARPDPE